MKIIDRSTKKMVWRLLWLLPIFFIYTHLTPVSFKEGSEKSADREELPPTAWIHSSWLDGFQPCQSFTLIHEHFHKSFSNPVCSIILFSWAFWVKPVFSHSGECAFVSCKWDLQFTLIRFYFPSPYLSINRFIWPYWMMHFMTISLI